MGVPEVQKYMGICVILLICGEFFKEWVSFCWYEILSRSVTARDSLLFCGRARGGLSSQISRQISSNYFLFVTTSYQICWQTRGFLSLPRFDWQVVFPRLGCFSFWYIAWNSCGLTKIWSWGRKSCIFNTFLSTGWFLKKQKNKNTSCFKNKLNWVFECPVVVTFVVPVHQN